MNIGVYGIGRFGYLWARLLAPHYTVGCYSRNPRHPVPPGTRAISFDMLCDCDVIFLCVAISAIDQALINIAPRVGSGALIMDTCSVKQYPIECMERELPRRVEIIGTHPMFGPDSVSYQSDSSPLVKGLPLVYCPARANESTIERWRSYFGQIGLQVITMTPSDHDKEAAYTQGITHFIGRLLEHLRLRKSSIATLGYQRLLAIIEQTCNDPYQLFLDLQRNNGYTAMMRGDLRRAFNKLIDEIGYSENCDDASD